MDWKQKFNEDYLKEGRMILLENRLIGFNRINNLLIAKIKGDNNRVFNVQIDTSDSLNYKFVCDCRLFSKNKACPHIAATLLNLEGFLNDSDISVNEIKIGGRIDLIEIIEKIEALKKEATNLYFNAENSSMMVKTIVKTRKFIQNELIPLAKNKEYENCLKISYKMMNTFYFNNLIFNNLLNGIEEDYLQFLSLIIVDKKTNDLLVQYLLKDYKNVSHRIVKRFISKVILEASVVENWADLYLEIEGILSSNRLDLNDVIFCLDLLIKYRFNDSLILAVLKKYRFHESTRIIEHFIKSIIDDNQKLNLINQVSSENKYYPIDYLKMITFQKAIVLVNLKQNEEALKEFDKLFSLTIDKEIVSTFITLYPNKGIDFVFKSFYSENEINDELIDLYLNLNYQLELFDVIVSTNYIEGVLKNHSLLAKLDGSRLLDYYLQYLSKSVSISQPSYLNNFVVRVYQKICDLDVDHKYQRIIIRNWMSMNHRVPGLEKIIENN